jgi:four helix bundle protein
MTQNPNNKQGNYDLEERTFKFSKKVADYVKRLLRTISNIEYGKQLVRSSGSVGANYIEANESLSKKDFTMRIKICKKESKESRYWLRLTEPLKENEKEELIDEAVQFAKIFGSIVEKSK